MRTKGIILYLCPFYFFIERFGKFTQLQFDGGFRMSGSGCTTYLLEKSRVVGHEAGERAYHVFYQAREEKQPITPSLLSCCHQRIDLACAREIVTRRALLTGV